MAAFTSWKDVLEDIRKDPVDTDLFYIIRMGNGADEERTRFMTRSEAIQFVVKQISW